MPVAEGKSVLQIVELLTWKLEMLGAEKQGTFCVDCETYHTAASTSGQPRSVRDGACGMAGTWFGVNRHSCSLNFLLTAEGGALDMWYMYLNSLIFSLHLLVWACVVVFFGTFKVLLISQSVGH